MNRRVIAAVAAILLAVTGGAMVLAYASSADARAMAGMSATAVLVVAAPVPEGTAAEDLSDLVTVAELPAKAVAAAAVTSLDQLAGEVATTELQVGEQVLTTRFADPATLQSAGHVDVPEGMQELSVLLESQRVLGSNLAAGDTVGVFVTKNGQTHLTLHRVLVTRVQGGITPAPTSAAEATAPTPSPDGAVMVTLALVAADAERVVWAQEHGGIWLSREPEEARQDGTRAVTEGNVYK